MMKAYDPRNEIVGGNILTVCKQVSSSITLGVVKKQSMQKVKKEWNFSLKDNKSI